MSGGGAGRTPFEARQGSWIIGERTERHAALEDLSSAVRRLVEATVATGHDVPMLRELAEEVHALAGKLESESDEDPWSARAYGTLRDAAGFMAINPAIGRANPTSPVVDIHVSEDGRELSGTIRFGLAHVGPPYRAHGGVVASLFDQLLGLVTMTAGTPGMTAGMSVTYRRATPIEEDVRFEIRYEGSDGRRSRSSGRFLDAEGRVTAEAEGTFIQPRSTT